MAYFHCLFSPAVLHLHCLPVCLEGGKGKIVGRTATRSLPLRWGVSLCLIALILALALALALSGKTIRRIGTTHSQTTNTSTSLDRRSRNDAGEPRSKDGSDRRYYPGDRNSTLQIHGARTIDPIASGRPDCINMSNDDGNAHHVSKAISPGIGH